MAIINFPVPYVPDPLRGRPLFNGQMFVGEPDLDPEVVANQKQLNVVQEDGTIVPVSQPFILSAGGVPVYNGATVRLSVDGNYSFKILSNLGAQVYYIENVTASTSDNGEMHTFPTVQSFKDSLIEFPDGKLIYLQDRGAVFTKVTGVGGNGFNVISSDNINQSIELSEVNGITFRMLGAFDAGVTYAIDAMQFAVDNYTDIKGCAGTYKWDKSLNMRSGVTVTMEKGAIVDAEDLDNTLYPSTLNFVGVIGSENALLSPLGRDDESISTSGGYSVGDLIHITSVRNSLSSADSGSWWLGGGTANARYAYFAEFNTIKSVDGGDVYGLSNSTIFPFYAINNAGETESLRTTSTTQLVTPVKDAHWVGGQIKRETSGNNIIYMYGAQDCDVVGVDIIKGSRLGNSFYIDKSYNCFGFDIKNTNDPELIWDYDTLHGKMNRFKVIGSHSCGFTGLTESYGAQSIDFSYSSADGLPLCNVRPYVKFSSFKRCYEGLTTHAGSYQANFTGNNIVNCLDDGIFDRSYQTVIQDNKIYATQETNDGIPPPTVYNPSYGVVIGYGGRRANVKGNTIRGFHGAFQIKSSVTSNWQYTNMLSSFTSNEVSRCFVGLNITGAGSENNAERFVDYSNNRHTLMGRFIVSLESYNQGVSITNNVLDGGFTYDGLGSYVAFVYAAANCPNLKITGNTWNRVKGSNSGYNSFMVTIGSVTDLAEFPEADFSGLTRVENNSVAFRDVDNVSDFIGSSSYIQLANEVNTDIVKPISSSAITGVPAASRSTYIILSSTGAENLDRVLPVDNAPWLEGDIIYLRQNNNSSDYTIRDVNSSGATSHGFQTPNNDDIPSISSNNVVQCIFSGTHWLVVSIQVTA